MTPRQNQYGESLGPASQYMHEADQKKGKPYSHQAYPRYVFHPDLGFEDGGLHPKTGHPLRGHAVGVLVKSPEHEEAVKAQKEAEGLDPKSWRLNPQNFGKAEDTRTPDEVKASLQDENAELKDSNVELQARLEIMRKQMADMQAAQARQAADLQAAKAQQAADLQAASQKANAPKPPKGDAKADAEPAK